MEHPVSSDARAADGPAVSIVIPCYRDEDHVAGLVAELEPVLASFEGGGELVLVDDGSPDRTGERALEVARGASQPVTVVRLARNFGQHPAVFAGLAAARGRIVVTADSDLQYPASEIVRLVDAVSVEAPVVSGYRADRRDPITRRAITGLLTRWLGRRTGQELHDYGSMFRAYDREVVDAMLGITERHRYVPAIPAWLGFRVYEIPVEHRPRGEQGSRYRLSSLLSLFLDLITSYSISPLRFVSIFAFACALVGFLATTAFLVYRIVVGAGIGGVVSAFALVFGLLAAQLLATTLISEYVGRIYVETRQRPYFIVRSTDRHAGSGGDPAAGGESRDVIA